MIKLNEVSIMAHLVTCRPKHSTSQNETETKSNAARRNATPEGST